MTEGELPETSTQGTFEKVFNKETEAVFARRVHLEIAGDDTLGLPEVEWDEKYRPSSFLEQTFAQLAENESSWASAVDSENVRRGLVGVALSGGGIRSSTFNLGVLQAIQRVGLFRFVDYLSTVSGGGFIGTYLITSMMEDAQRQPARAPGFPFLHEPGVEENRRFRHLRNYSNYLAPGGKSELLGIPIVLLRGLLINALFITPFLLVIALLGALMGENPVHGYYLKPFAFLYGQLAAFLEFLGLDVGSGKLHDYLWRFPASTVVFALLLLSFALYPLVSTFSHVDDGGREIEARKRRRGALGVCSGVLVIGIALAFVELQPIALNWLGDFGAMLAGVLGGSAASMLVADKVISKLKDLGRKIGVGVYGALGVLVLWLLTLYLMKNVAEGWSLIPVLGWIAGLFLLSIAFVDVNAISIHKFYRDHLVKAFVAQAAEDDCAKDNGAPDPADSKVPKLSELDVCSCPYQLINAAVNVQRADEAFRSGRGASFFFFSPLFCGGIRTEYIHTKNLERIAGDLDVGTAMAVSGAAIAPNMGKVTNRLTAFVLALLNVRLNYWLPNPKAIRVARDLAAERGPEASEPLLEPVSPNTKLSMRERKIRYDGVGPLYLLREMFGWLDADSTHVNLSDGGHIENLGVYELLRRQCRLIIAGDGECDSDLSFEGLAEVIRLARIDFGFRIDMEGLDEIRSGEQHHAVGTIHYSPERIGKLIYIKSNLGGDYNLQATLDPDFYRTSADRDDDRLFDENAYVAHYRHKNPDFPQESTADQFFDEAQFESYRALGYQVAASALIEPWTSPATTEIET